MFLEIHETHPDTSNFFLSLPYYVNTWMRIQGGHAINLKTERTLFFDISPSSWEDPNPTYTDNDDDRSRCRIERHRRVLHCYRRRWCITTSDQLSRSVESAGRKYHHFDHKPIELQWRIYQLEFAIDTTRSAGAWQKYFNRKTRWKCRSTFYHLLHVWLCDHESPTIKQIRRTKVSSFKHSFSCSFRRRERLAQNAQ